MALRDRGFSGRVTLVGGEPLLPYERPPLSKDGLLHGAEPRWIADADRYQELAIDLRTGVTATRLDRDRKSAALSDGTVLNYDRLLLATGARPRELANVTSPRGYIRSLRTHADALALRPFLGSGRSVVILGGGFIGLEVAASARRLGAAVTLLEGLPRVLSRGVAPEIAMVIAARHAAEGVDIRCGTSLVAVEEGDDGVRIALADGSRIRGDLLIVGIGSIPNTHLAEEAGLAVDNGIAVDSSLATSDPDIFAAGDCCSFPSALFGGRRLRLESWRSAQEQGALAAANMLDMQDTLSSVPWFWSDQFDLTLQVAGLADGAATTVRRDLSPEAFVLFQLDEEGRLVGASGIGPGNAVARDIRLAEMLIAARKRPDPAALANADIKLKQLLAA